MSAQRVDPFIPIATSRHAARPYPGLVNNIPRTPAPTSPKPTVDAVRRPAVALPSPQRTRSVVRSQTDAVRPAVASRPVPVRPVAKAKTPKARSKHRILRSLRTPALAVGIMIAGVFIQTAAFGEVTIAAYTVFALWKRVPSRTSFLLALLSLVGVVTLLLVKTNDGLAATFTIYTFLLLGAGVLGIAREMRAEDA